MAGTRSRADSMRLLARVESAREDRCRAEMSNAELVQQAADARFRSATEEGARAQEQRRTLLRRDYSKALGRHPSQDIQALRAFEQRLAEQQHAALAEQQAADLVAREARAACDRARDTLRMVSQRSLARGRIADTLRRQETLVAMAAEEEAVADELMDRAGTMVGA